MQRIVAANVVVCPETYPSLKIIPSVSLFLPRYRVNRIKVHRFLLFGYLRVQL